VPPVIMLPQSESKLDPRVAAAKDVMETDSAKGREQLRQVIALEGTDVELIKAKEQAISCLTRSLADGGQAWDLKQLLQDLHPLYATIPKAKTAKIVRTVIDALARVPNTAALQVRLLFQLHRLVSTV
jgi:26S proteasome regulatory subunit N6